MKTIFGIIRARPRLFFLGWVVLMIGLFALRLAQGPINVDALRPLIISRVEAQLPHTRASIRHLDLVWFGDARAVGFRVDNLMILDSKNRIIVRAAKVESALAADSLALAHFAPAHLTADDFFVAASVSKEGRYDLGYEARGTPGAIAGLDQLLFDLTGRERLGKPMSFVRQAALTNGQLRMVQPGVVDWTARVNTVSYSKLRNQLNAAVDLAIDSATSHATIKADAKGEVGLKTASISANITGLVPAQIFANVGTTRLLSTVHAPLDGLARIDYSAKGGFVGAWADLKAGTGHIDFGGSRQDFDSANLRAEYASADRTIHFKTFRVKAHLIDTDLSGTVRLIPADAGKKQDLTLDYDFAGPRVTGRLADDFAYQTLTGAHISGNFVPAQHRLKIDTVTGSLNGSPFEGQGIVYTDDKGRLGADLTAKIKGHFTKDEVFAFWPEHLSNIVRGDLIKRIKGGDYANAEFVLKAPPGAFEPDQLQDDQLRLDFDFWNLGLEIDDRMQNATGLKGHGILLGNSFAMDVTGGRLVNVVLTHGALEVPSFHDQESHTRIGLESESEAVAVIEAVDPLADGELSRHGLNQERMTGQSKVRVEIDFPTFHDITDRNFSLKFAATIKDAGLKNAALGWDMTHGDLMVNGDLLADSLEVRGPAQLGPYTGDISYRTQFVPKTQKVDFAGSFNAAQFGGSPRVPVPITGHFAMANGTGQGTVNADIFKGTVDWTGETGSDERPQNLTIDGVILADGMERQGLPIFERLDRELPTRISLVRSGDIWAGEIAADDLSGDLAYVQGQRPRLVYTSIISPDEASRLGYGALPMFKSSRHLTVNVALDSDSKEALIRLDNLNATLGWSEVPGREDLLRRMTLRMQPEDWATVGLPDAFFKPKAPVDVTALWAQSGTTLDGTVSLLGQDIAFTMPLRHRAGPDGAPVYVAPSGDAYDLRVSGDVTPTMLAALGYSQTPVRVDGPVGVVFSLYDTPDKPAAVLNLDAARAELGVKATDWTKPVGEQAAFAVSFDASKSQDGKDQGGVNLSRIYGEGDHVRVEGRASFDNAGALEFADFSSLYLKDFIDVTFKYYALEDRPASVLSISGQQLDLRPWLDAKRPGGTTSDTIQAAVDVADKPAGRPTHLVVDLARLQTSAAGAFQNLKLDLNWDGRNGLEGQGTAGTMNGSPLALAMKDEGDYSLFSLNAHDLGDVIRTESGIANVWGGTGTIEGAYRDGQLDASVRGEDVRVKQIPVLAQLLTVASLEGLADTLTGEGIAFSDFDIPVRYKDHTVFIKDGWARGGALGINIWGTTDLDAKRMKLNGTLIPAYSINGIFGDVKSNGLGLVGLKYDVGGTFKTPSVAVNPLSIILPGFIKVWADRGRQDAIEALDLPKTQDKLADLRAEAETISGN